MPDNSSESPNRIRQALNRIYEGQPPYFQEYLRRYKQDPKSRIFAPLAEAYRKQGDTDEAIEICKAGLNHHPDFSGGRVTLARCYMDKEMWPDAKRELLYVVDRVPENLLAQKLLGELFLNEGNRAEALRCYKFALVQSPGDENLTDIVDQLEREAASNASTNVSPNPESEWATDSVEEEGSSDAPSVEGEFLSANEGEAGVELIPNVTSDGRIEMVPFDPDDHEEHVNRILGFEEDEDEREPFKVEHVSALFEEEESRPEITTQTLGDLYFSQGQYDKSLRIYERIAASHPSEEVNDKIDACRMKLGVAQDSLAREKKIEKLRGILNRVRT